MRHQDQAFELFPLFKDYSAEDSEFTKIIKVDTRSRLPPDAIIISSHVIYEIKLNDDSSLKLKAIISTWKLGQ